MMLKIAKLVEIDDDTYKKELAKRLYIWIENLDDNSLLAEACHSAAVAYLSTRTGSKARQSEAEQLADICPKKAKEKFYAITNEDNWEIDNHTKIGLFCFGCASLNTLLMQYTITSYFQDVTTQLINSEITENYGIYLKLWYKTMELNREQKLQEYCHGIYKAMFFSRENHISAHRAPFSSS